MSTALTSTFGLVWFRRFAMAGLVWQVLFGRFGLVGFGLVGLVS